MIILNKHQLRARLDPGTTIGLMRTAMRQVSAGDSLQPLRWGMSMPAGGMMGMMPGYLAEPECFGIKVVNMMPANRGSHYSSHSGCMLLFDAVHGQPLALLDAGELTASRTAAASALATDLLARATARILVIIGAGEQARAHIDALCTVRSFDEIRVCFRDPDQSQAFFATVNPRHAARLRGFTDIAAAMAGADVACTVTSSASPVLKASMLQPGLHINLVGACTRDRQEIETGALPGCRYLTDSSLSAWDQAGELATGVGSGVIDESYIAGEIGAVIDGDIEGRRNDEEITIYRSLGVAAQDLVVAHHLYLQATQESFGTEVDF
ncbi:ornithine cyclodeaminase family protein [Kineobactrum salinum]|uniref:Ornithine cyclodeaminase family protein n=1 Tax=Kineobactrum salinum TaxID=2708301 RepID=A0A6C0U3P9_9GAMM|nr:ornithine cyclodeaminase family protein [Kineobactrum salinum]QIB66473.1 ornithine cyclodeaminase family protein [Kineobactrum salinum]